MNVIMRFLSVLIIFVLSVPSKVLSEVGFRDLKVGQPSNVIEEHCDFFWKPSFGNEKFHCYDNKDYQFSFEFTDTQTISSVAISSNPKTDFEPSFYSDKSSKFWEMRQNFVEKYEYVKCENKGFKKFFLGENIFGTDYFVTSTSNNDLIWIIFSVHKRVDTYGWLVEYVDDNNPGSNPIGEIYTDIFMKNCSLTDFKTDEF